ncbi:MAG: hypothetical protein ABI759_17965, partial [Candidatus Solibacter sp.]
MRNEPNWGGKCWGGRELGRARAGWLEGLPCRPRGGGWVDGGGGDFVEGAAMEVAERTQLGRQVP